MLYIRIIYWGEILMNFIIFFLYTEVYMYKKLYFNDYDIDDLK